MYLQYVITKEEKITERIFNLDKICIRNECNTGTDLQLRSITQVQHRNIDGDKCGCDNQNSTVIVLLSWLARIKQLYGRFASLHIPYYINQG
jgi:hypothetical protein